MITFPTTLIESNIKYKNQKTDKNALVSSFSYVILKKFKKFKEITLLANLYRVTSILPLSYLVNLSIFSNNFWLVATMHG